MRRALLLLASCGGNEVSALDASMNPDAGDAAFADAPADARVRPPDGLAILATKQPVPFRIAADGTNVYWTNHDGVMRCAAVGCGQTPTILAAEMGPGAIALGANDVYFTIPEASQGKVMRVPIAGGPTRELAWNQNGPVDLAFANGRLFWTNTRDGTIKSCTGDCANPIELASAQPYAHGMAVGGASAYWMTLLYDAGPSGELRSAPIDGGSPVRVTSLYGNSEAVATDGMNVYFESAGAVMKCAAFGDCTTPTIIAPMQGLVRGIAADGANVYWTDDMDGRVWKCAVNDCISPTMIDEASGSHPAGIAVDDTSVYWTLATVNGKVMRYTPK